MNATIQSNVMTVITKVLAYFFGDDNRNLPDSASVPGHLLFGYGGAALAFFLSCYGAYKVGTTMIEIIENDLWSFIDDYSVTSADKFINLMENVDVSKGMEDFLVYYAIDVLVLACATFVHMGFLITMGTASGWLLLDKLKELNVIVESASSTSSMLLNRGWPLLFFGMLNGVTNYVAGEAVTLS